MEILAIVGYGVGVVGAVVGLASKTKNDNYNDLKERVAILEKDREEAREQHLENQKSIANLEGQLKTYKDIPLRRIDESLALLAESNGKILETLQGSANIAADEKRAQGGGGLLVKTEEKHPLDVKVKN